MKTTIQADTVLVEFPRGGVARIALCDIDSIEIQTIPTMTVDVDLIILGHESGEFLEITDEAEGFREAAAYLSEKFGIAPAIHQRFPANSITRLYKK